MQCYFLELLRYTSSMQSLYLNFNDQYNGPCDCNFDNKDDVEARFSHCVNLIEKGGRFYLRANPGISHKTGPYVDIFPWTFGVVNEFTEKYNLKLDTFKQDSNNKLFFVYTKL